MSDSGPYGLICGVSHPVDAFHDTVTMWSVQTDDEATAGSSAAGTSRGEFVRLTCTDEAIRGANGRFPAWVLLFGAWRSMPSFVRESTVGVEGVVIGGVIVLAAMMIATSDGIFERLNSKSRIDAMEDGNARSKYSKVCPFLL